MTRPIRTVAATLVMAAWLDSGNASANPGSDTHGRVLASGQLADTFEIRSEVPTVVTFQRVTIEPGGKTGWHTHPGNLLVVVAAGELTHTGADTCADHVYRSGEAFIESGGANVHEGRNLGMEPVILYVAYVTPLGRPMRLEADDPGCGF